jgi:hypothetical protein
MVMELMVNWFASGGLGARLAPKDPADGLPGWEWKRVLVLVPHYQVALPITVAAALRSRPVSFTDY